MGSWVCSNLPTYHQHHITSPRSMYLPMYHLNTYIHTYIHSCTSTPSPHRHPPTAPHPHVKRKYAAQHVLPRAASHRDIHTNKITHARTFPFAPQTSAHTGQATRLATVPIYYPGTYVHRHRPPSGPTPPPTLA